MFGWFKKKPELSPETEGLADTLFGAQALAIAIAECVRDHFLAVKDGRIDYPAHRRRGSNVEAIWTDVRMEAMQKMFGFGQSDPMMLANMPQQSALLASFLNERPHLEFPQPRGQPVADTLQGVWQIYVYLDAVGSEVMDRETDRASLKAQGRDITSSFTSDAIALLKQWAEFEKELRTKSGPLPQRPQTIIEILWKDVTAKTKSIALSVIFGPYYENGMNHMLKTLEGRATTAEIAAVKATLDRVREANQPEDIRLS